MSLSWAISTNSTRLSLQPSAHGFESSIVCLKLFFGCCVSQTSVNSILRRQHLNGRLPKWQAVSCSQMLLPSNCISLELVYAMSSLTLPNATPIPRPPTSSGLVHHSSHSHVT